MPHLTFEEVRSYLVESKGATLSTLSSFFNVSKDFMLGFVQGNPHLLFLEDIGYVYLKGLGKDYCFSCGGWKPVSATILGRKYDDSCLERNFLDRTLSTGIKIYVPDFKEERSIECGMCEYSWGIMYEDERVAYCNRFFFHDTFEPYVIPAIEKDRRTIYLGNNLKKPACQFFEPSSQYEELIPEEFLKKQEKAKKATIAYMQVFSIPRELIPSNIEILMRKFEKCKASTSLDVKTFLRDEEVEKIEEFLNQEQVKEVERALRRVLYSF